MIAPGIRIVGVEPDGFGVLCSLVPSHKRPTRGELHVLHDRGRVLRAVHTLTGPTADHREPLGRDLPAAAQRLRAAANVERVVLVDRDGLAAQADAFAAAGPSSIDQPAMMRRSQQLFWSSPAVVTDPEPPSTATWERLAAHLRDLGADYWALLAGYEGDTCAFTLLARFVDGQAVLMTSLEDSLGTGRPAASEASRLVAAAEERGPVRLALVAPLDVLRTVAASADLPTALAACAPQALISRGLPT
jgi:hypothetical protein